MVALTGDRRPVDGGSTAVSVKECLHLVLPSHLPVSICATAQMQRWLRDVDDWR